MANSEIHTKRKKRSHNDLTRRELLKCGIYGGLASGLSVGLGLSGCKKQRSQKNKRVQQNQKRQQRGDRPNIILITLDTTRADHLGCYGYNRNTSPNLDRLASESILYTRAIAPSSWTLPSHASLFTGKFTSSHGARYDANGPLYLSDAVHTTGSRQTGYRARGLAQDELTLATILKQNGYETGAVVGGPWMKKIFGLDKGFEFYDDDQISTTSGRLACQVTASALNWIENSQEREFFLFLNYFDPHAPYMAAEGFAKAFLPKNAVLSQKDPSIEERIALYDAEILYMDHYIDKLLHKLKDWNLFENTFIIVTADHGELFGEHGKFKHGHYLYQQEIHVPLFLKYPGMEVAPDQTDVPVQLNDIFAIILDRMGIDLPQGIQAGVPPEIGHPIIAETYPISRFSSDGDWRVIIEGDFKFIWSSKDNHMLFNLKDDPGESVNLIHSIPKRAETMAAQLDQYVVGLPKPGLATPTQQLDESTRKALESHGYVR
jgi:arylsulfatase A-like enzyme